MSEPSVLERLKVLEVTVDALPESRGVVADAIAEIETLTGELDDAQKIIADYEEIQAGLVLQLREYSEAQVVGWECSVGFCLSLNRNLTSKNCWYCKVKRDSHARELIVRPSRETEE